MTSAADVEAADRTLTIGSWTITIGAIVYSVLTVTPLMAGHTAPGWVWTAPILPLVVDSAVVIVVRLDAALARLHAQAARDGATPRRSVWPFLLRWLTGLMTLVLNVGDSALRGDLVGVGVHIPAPLLLIVNAEAALAYRRAIAAALVRIEREQRERQEREQAARQERERLAREERERERERRERLAREEREQAERLERERREHEAAEQRQAREHAAALERERLASQERRAEAERQEAARIREEERTERLAREEREREERRREQAAHQAREQARIEREQRERQERERLVRERSHTADAQPAKITMNTAAEAVNTPAPAPVNTSVRTAEAAREHPAAAVHAAAPAAAMPGMNSAVNTGPKPVNTAKLSEDEALEAVRQSLADGLTVREAADRTGWSVGWVSARYRDLRAAQQPTAGAA
ncbi:MULTISPECIES: hypothetical protein [Streptomyces]|uniref:Uncharacterized protein n=3 Tax=Streptomyces rimosus TaxID=1927 RepID=L8EMB8_STRR1|nr:MULTISPECIES: hypothetical protein [Streptomyces]MYT44403.1 hypothetical protein [Streptomyces sp. SID5471]KEF08187.1 hypothetical protein DF17_07815 [Streptomyces rimosus]KUJ42720.1 hypothetical protein ADK46_03910 [Streptomyces rimosus subsp. rimosus]QEV76800.1 hypothetical protein CP984_18900 [Streptomyces rimosus]QGY65533.1 hypothetical protein V519_006115 [Streptomyces rimosus R6-500]